MKKKLLYSIILIILIFPIIGSLFTKNPEGTGIQGEFCDIKEVEFIYDLTYQKEGKTFYDPNIFEEQLHIINRAEEFILMDIFLFNDAYDREKQQYSANIDMITQALLEKKEENPEMEIMLITDPINNFYGAYKEEHIQTLKENGISTVITDLDQLKDSNPLYSGYYRTFFKWFGTEGKGWITNPIASTAPDVSMRSVLKLLNFKANHRKVLITEREAMVSSSNPHDPSANHSNVAMKVTGEILNQMIASEQTVASFSGAEVQPVEAIVKEDVISDTKVRLITEQGILSALLENMQRARQGDTIQVGIFYISDFKILNGLKEAANRGAKIQIIADPNKDAFGIKKNGSPNRMALTDLVSKNHNIQVRWYDTHGEQYHSKIAFFGFEEENRVILGSGNYTRRNIAGYNLESDLEVVTPKNSILSRDIEMYFDTLWNNIGGQYTVAFEEYEDNSAWKKLIYRIQELTGVCTF